jgi:hypothetical protein
VALGTRERRWRAFIWSRFIYANAATLWATSIWYLYFMHIISYEERQLQIVILSFTLKKARGQTEGGSYLQCRSADGTFLARRAPHQPLPSRTDSHFFLGMRLHSRSVLHMSKRRGRTARARLSNRTLETTLDHGKGLQLRAISIFSNEITEPQDPLHSCTRY